jgi:hypothetical protein
MNPRSTTLSPQKEVVRVFYKELWDHADKRLIPVIFHEGFTFRGSLGPTLVGHDQFAGYVDFVTETFGQYTTDILAMIEKGIASAAKCVSTVFIVRNCSSATERPPCVVDRHAESRNNPSPTRKDNDQFSHLAG